MANMHTVLFQEAIKSLKAGQRTFCGRHGDPRQVSRNVFHLAMYLRQGDALAEWSYQRRLFTRVCTILSESTVSLMNRNMF